jgi:hypothetical protein
MSNRSSPCGDGRDSTVDNGTGGRGEAWVQLIREVIASWPLVLRAAVLMLAFSPVAVAVGLVLLVGR